MLEFFMTSSKALFVSIFPIRPVVRMTGMKNIALNAARPRIFWFRMIAMNMENRTMAGTSVMSCLNPSVSLVRNCVSTMNALE